MMQRIAHSTQHHSSEQYQLAVHGLPNNDNRYHTILDLLSKKTRPAARSHCLWTNHVIVDVR